MRKSVIVGVLLTLLSVSLLSSFKIPPAKAIGTIYIRADGSVDPPTAPIHRNGEIYTFSDNIYDYDSIVVEKDNIVVDGAGYTVRGTGYGNGIVLSGRSNVTIKNTKFFVGGGFDAVILDSSSHNNVVGNHITMDKQSRHGIGLNASSDNNIFGNIIEANQSYGISLRYSSYNNITGNDITNGFIGFSLFRSSYNSVVRNNITNNTLYGLGLEYSCDHNNIVGNTIANNYRGISHLNSSYSSILGNNIAANNVGGAYLYWSFSNRILGNQITANNDFCVILDSSSNNSVCENNIAANNGNGVQLQQSSSNNSICGNNMTNNRYGITFGSSSNNSVCENNIAANKVGIYLYYSTDNAIYHDNFVDNTEQVHVYSLGYPNVWDDGYPSGGNYWSDYAGVDANGDGIGDTPYIIDSNNQDRYPLMNPWSTEAPWSMFMHDLKHTGVSPYRGPQTNETTWVIAISDIGILRNSPVVGKDGTIYIGGYVSGKSKFYAINPNGTTQWSFDMLGQTEISGTPAIGKDGAIYFATSGGVNYNGQLWCLNPNGTLRWVSADPALSHFYVVDTGLAIGIDQTIYVTPSVEERLIAVDPNGTAKWSKQLGARTWSSPAIADDGTIYVAQDLHKLFAFNPDGSELWSITLRSDLATVYMAAPAIGEDGTIYLADYDKLYAVTPSGEIAWSIETPAQGQFFGYSSPAIGKTGTIYVAATSGSNNAQFCAVNPNGTLEWVFNIEGDAYLWSSPAIGNDGTIYFGAIGGNIYALNSDGSLKWKYETGREVAGSPAIGLNGLLIVADTSSSGGNLYAFGPTLPTPDFSMATFPTSLTIQQGTSSSSTITITSLNGFDQLVFLTVSGVPSGVTASLSSQFVAPEPGGSETSTLTVTADSTASPGSYALTVTGTSGTLTHSTDIYLEITAAPQNEWTFAIITDLHIGRGYKESGHSSNYNGEDYYLTDRLQKVVDWITQNRESKKIEFVAVLGDITEDGTEVEMNKAKEILDQLNNENIPYFPVIGNHDHTGEDDQYFESVFNTAFFDMQHTKLGTECTRWVDEYTTISEPGNPVIHLRNYAFEYRGKNLVFLDFVDRATILGMPKLETQTMDFLREQLNQAEPTVLFSHHPLIESLSNFHTGITGADTWTDLDGNITSASATVLANFAGHVHGYYDPNLPNYFSPQDFADAEQALAEQENHPTLKLKTPQFYNASYNYKGSQFATAGDIPVITTEAMMVGSNTNTKNGIIRIVKVTEDSFDTWTPEDTAFPSLNPYIVSATTSGVHLSGNDVDFQVYAFTTIFSPIQPINYSLYVDGDFSQSVLAEPYVTVKFENQRLSRGTHEVNLTVVGYAPDGSPVVESIKRTVIVGRLTVHLKCPADIIVTDPLGRSIGKEVNEIPEATYTEADLDEDGDIDEFVEILAPIDGDYVITLNGTDLGSYSMIAQFATSQEVVNFNATGIPVSSAAIHQYTIDWTALSQSVEGVTVQVDSDSDGVFEHTFASDSELTQREYVIATDSTPPETQLNIDEPKFVVNGVTYLTSATPIELTAEDDLGGSGVASTAHRIRNDTYTGDWMGGQETFYFVGLSDGTYEIDFNSTDNLGNTETTHQISVTLFSWNYVFEDTYGRRTMLKINTAYKFFQFITPDKDYGIIKTTYMQQSGRAIIISHLDKQLQLITVAVDTKLDFCVATAWDRQTRKQYFLLDKPGIEK